MSKFPLVSIKSVTVSFEGQPVLKDLSWELYAQTCWVISGANGAGKSTLLKLLRGDVWPDPVGGGQRRYCFNEVIQDTPAQLKERIALVSPEQQERYWRQEWNLTAYEVIASGLKQSDYSAIRLSRKDKEEVTRAAEILSVGHLLNRDVQRVSQGELRRVLIARSLVSKPVCLLLDEVTQGLDVDARMNLLETLESISKSETSIVYTTHRTNERFSRFTRKLKLHAGRIVDDRDKCDTTNHGTPRPSFCRSRVDHDQNPILVNVASSKCSPESTNCDPAETLISLRGVDVFLDRRRVLQDLNWRMRSKEHWAVLGKNGSGKTTFLKTVIGDIHPAFGGTVDRFEGEAITTLWDVRERVGYLSADFQAAYESESKVGDVIASGFFGSVGVVGRLKPSQKERVQALIKICNLKDVCSRRFDTLSYGLRRRVLLARAVVHVPRLLALDEPFDGLDPESRELWCDALQSFARSGIQILMITHHVEDLPSFFTHALWFEDGRIAAEKTLA